MEATNEADGDALIEAERETSLEAATLSSTCPWSFDDAMKADWYPD